MSLLSRVVSKLDIPKKDAKEAIKAVMSSIIEEVKEEGSVSITGFGSFTAKPYKRTSFLNGKTFHVDKNVVRFKAGSPFDAAVNEER